MTQKTYYSILTFNLCDNCVFSLFWANTELSLSADQAIVTDIIFTFETIPKILRAFNVFLFTPWTLAIMKFRICVYFTFNIAKNMFLWAYRIISIVWNKEFLLDKLHNNLFRIMRHLFFPILFNKAINAYVVETLEAIIVQSFLESLLRFTNFADSLFFRV